MQRRDFLKISAITGATAVLDSCGGPERQLIRFVPEDNLVPGIAVLRPGVCTLCAAGCGLTVRVMRGDAEVIRDGKPGLISMALAKKLEGNPGHPINRGRLCPRGQAGIQVTYHPDRLRNPLRRSGEKGSGQFQEISWDDAMQEVVTRLKESLPGKDKDSVALLSRPLSGQRRELLRRFSGIFGTSPIFFEPLDDTILRQANFISFGAPQLPTFDLANTNFVLSFGADFLGTWNSPVAQAAGYGEMRQGRRGIRAGFVQVEQRMSLTGANADRWIPAKPGTEGILALGIAHLLMADRSRPRDPSGRAGVVIAGWAQGLPDYTPENVEKQTGVPASTLEQLTRDLSSHQPAVVMIAGAPLAQSNGLFNALAVNALNALLTNQGKPGGIFFTPQPAGFVDTKMSNGASGVFDLATRIQGGRIPQVLMLFDADPVFGAPAATGMHDALAKIPFLVSFGSFIDDTSVLADLILPDHSPLESWVDHSPESGSMTSVVGLAPPVMAPLHNTRAAPDVLLEIARQMPGGSLPWDSYDAMLKAAVLPLQPKKTGAEAIDPDDFWKQVQDQGGWWGPEAGNATVHAAAGLSSPPRIEPRTLANPQFSGDEKEFPFYFQPYASQMLDDGSLAHLPWLQEAPDPLSTVMWNTWVEINPKTAQQLNISQGDTVEVASTQGKLRAQALLNPGIAPDVIAMPIGQGHEHFTRYGSGRGANPLSIVAPVLEPETGSLAWAATRVKVSRTGEGALTLFAGGLNRLPLESEPR